jgi:hypothetical protein
MLETPAKTVGCVAIINTELREEDDVFKWRDRGPLTLAAMPLRKLNCSARTNGLSSQTELPSGAKQ